MSYKLTAYKGLLILTVCFQTSCIAKNTQKSKDFTDSARSVSAPDAAQKTNAKNIILFIGDGMGVSTVTAARIFDGQAQGLKGEEHNLAFEDFENLAMVKTYNTNAQVPDSAGTATAIMSGYKTNIGTVNVRPNTDVRKMVFEDCIRKKSPPTLTDIVKRAGLSVGIISTARITHATPAAMYGHAVSRGSDKELQDWQSQPGHSYVTDAAGFRSAPKNQTLMGLFTPSHMSYEADRDDSKEPSLAEMTSVAIDALSQRDTGYVLMVEAGRVDHAHHGTNAYRALRDMQALRLPGAGKSNFRACPQSRPRSRRGI